MAGKIILIDRQYGSGGREVGKRLADRLGIPFYDGQMLMIAAEKFGLSANVMAEYDEKNIKSMIYMIAMNADYNNGDGGMLPRKIYQAMQETIIRLANEGPCVIVGRCADYILEDKVEYINTFIYASDMQKRIDRAIKVDNIKAKDAPSYIKKRDRQRREYYNFHTDRRWGETSNYDICLNTSTLGYDRCVDIIENLVK
ncbi:MAG: cytidylate kinase-like family protein [Lachnospiraceae bacterium]|nr:cytidylate kinase-like family protein [Lachnospiraceae bacterium]